MLPAHLIAAAGADLKLEATNFLALGAGWYEGSACGLAGRHFGTWDEKVGDVGIVMGLFNHHWEVVDGVPRVSGDYDFNVLAPLFGRPMYASTAPGFLSWCSLRATAVVVVGFDVQLRLGELADLFAGVAGYDPSDDDTSARRYSAASGW